MAEANVAKAAAAAAAANEEVVVGEVAVAPMKELVKQSPPVPEPEKRPRKMALLSALAAEAAEERRAVALEENAMAASTFDAGVFSEESTFVADLGDHEKKALDELKQLVRAALAGHDFSPPLPAGKNQQEGPPVPTPPEYLRNPASEEEDEGKLVHNAVKADEDGAKTVEAIEETVVSVVALPTEKEVEKTAPEVLIWGVPLLADERSDTVLLKFLRARDFDAKEAMAMLKAAVLWREEFGVEALLEEDLGVPDLERVVFMHGADRAGHPVCYSVYGELQSKAMHSLVFADEEKKKRFLRWRIQHLEKGIRDLLNFTPGGISTMVQVADLKNAIRPAKEIRLAFALLQDNYPEFVAKQIFINVPWWYLAFHRMMSPFFTKRTRSKFVFAGPSKTSETLFKYIVPEQVPVQYGGLSRENDPDFTIADAATHLTIKPSVKQDVEILVSEKCIIVWELRILGWDVTYSAEFVPSLAGRYTVVVQKERKLSAMDDPILKDTFKVGEPGKIVLSVHNTSSKKKNLLCRYKIKSSN
ncbi:patellin-3-like [Curcuma longa]|uniref:patellin-3-like n=1 Tax=Curcuma longa TaxID=136217 RepID=UPI003D9EB374